MRAVPLIDTMDAWRSLPPETRDRIGVSAIAHALGRMGVTAHVEPEEAFAAAYLAGIDALERLVTESLPEAFDADGLPCRRPDLAALGVRACRTCGCTDACGCREGCHWVAEDLCSACAGNPTP